MSFVGLTNYFGVESQTRANNTIRLSGLNGSSVRNQKENKKKIKRAICGGSFIAEGTRQDGENTSEELQGTCSLSSEKERGTRESTGTRVYPVRTVRRKSENRMEDGGRDGGGSQVLNHRRIRTYLSMSWVG